MKMTQRNIFTKNTRLRTRVFLQSCSLRIPEDLHPLSSEASGEDMKPGILQMLPISPRSQTKVLVVLYSVYLTTPPPPPCVNICMFFHLSLRGNSCSSEGSEGLLVMKMMSVIHS
ncbi:hypothetical protein FQA47_008061 [Oryzias melastigma]|uniref:Uncharacterized protein n=1 Tax=Oryzias melastigma TaxID=30732 RepID=A0A834CML9_ORYME|nr:hypothetical protein FQA47_008061 [Oryzias melastigma]